MAKIHILSQKVRDQIAAGEVVERPASVIKELLENALDAKATHIEIRIEEGGKKSIQVIDNGEGMSPEDAKKCTLRHSTSKIEDVDDLFQIHSFGFRGEALASIASVSEFCLSTKDQEHSTGMEIKINAGEKESENLKALPTGTRISVTDLFKPVPARKAYLKTAETEYRMILKEIQAFALSLPHVSFILYKDGKKVLDLASQKDQKSRIQQILKKYAHDLIPLEANFHHMKISGFITKPGMSIASRQNQFLFVNGRRIDDGKLAYAIREGYVQSCGIEKHLFPIFVLHLDIDPIMVDINVHPRKLEVKFAEPGEVFSALKESVIRNLEKNPTPSNTSTSFPLPKASPYKSSFSKNAPQKSISQNKPFLFDQIKKGFSHLSAQRDEITLPPPQIEKDITLFGQVANKYILALSGTGMYFFDQHALHERQRFEDFWKAYKSKKITSQNLLVPQTIDLNQTEISQLAEHQELLKTLGFEVKFPADTQIQFSAIPDILADKDLEDLCSKLIEHLETNQIGENALDLTMRKILEYKACRGAIMFGDKLNNQEMEKLLVDFHKTEWNLLCPHGRPCFFFFSFESMDKKFHR